MNAMEWIQTLLISGLCIPSICAHYRQHCLVETPKSWSDAQSYCRERGFDLATIDDTGAMEALLPLIADSGYEYWWIGLHYGGLEAWHWSLADKDFYQEGERSYSNFIRFTGNSRFVVTEHGWWDTVANTKYFFICYDGNRQGPDRYVEIRKTMSWTEAQAYCRSHHTDLVSIRNPAENQAVWDEAGVHRVLIGLFRDGWLWSDNRSSSFRHWIKDSFVGKFPASCAAMTRHISGKWEQLPCAELHPFLCTCTRKRVLKVKVRSEDMQDLNDPAAMKAAILKQTQQLLEDATLTNGLKMTWKTHSDGQVFTKEQGQEEDTF